MIIQRLNDPDVTHDEAASIISEVEYADVPDPQDRRSLAAALFSWARRLPDGCDRWGAIRRWTSLVSLDEIPALGEFLTDATPRFTLQCVFQSIANAMRSELLPSTPAFETLRVRVREMTDVLLRRIEADMHSPSVVDSVSVTCAAVTAALFLEDAGAMDLFGRLDTALTPALGPDAAFLVRRDAIRTTYDAPVDVLYVRTLGVPIKSSEETCDDPCLIISHVANGAVGGLIMIGALTTPDNVWSSNRAWLSIPHFLRDATIKALERLRAMTP